MDNRMVNLRTERCVLRTPVLKDVEARREWRGDPQVCRWLTNSGTKYLDTAWKKTVLGDDNYSFVITRYNVPIGDCILVHLVEGMYKMVFSLRKDLWGHGYMTEAIKSILDWVAHNEASNIEEIVADTFISNFRAKGVLLTNDFQMEQGTVVYSVDTDPMPGVRYVWRKPCRLQS